MPHRNNGHFTQLVARFDRGYSCESFCSAQEQKVYAAVFQQKLDLASQFTGRHAGIEICTRAGGLGEVSVGRNHIGWKVVALSRPRAYKCKGVEQGLRYGLLIKVAFTQDKKVPDRVILGGCVTSYLGLPQLIDVASMVNTDVVGDIYPSQLVLVMGRLWIPD